MASYLKRMGIIFSILLIFPAAYSYQLYDPYTDYTVLPDKTYKGEICIRYPELGDSFTYTYDINYDIISEINIKEDPFIYNSTNQLLTGNIICNEFNFTVNNYKTSLNDTFIQKIQVTNTEQEGNIKIAYSKRLTIDASNLDYKDLLFNMSKKFILVFISIYAVFASILYIIKSKKFNE